ncbi:MAG: hypothetical protein FWD13_04150 [Treponema sp.]|nr:hypothetical protein [Treponema sp.]
MKNNFKFKAIQRIAGIITLMVIVGFSFIACDESGNGGGTTWTAITDNTFNNRVITSITYGDGTFIAAAAYDGIIAYSSDGITWTRITDEIFNTNRRIEDIIFADDKFIAVGSSSQHTNANGLVVYSLDNGKTWEEASAASNFFFTQCITYGNGMFVAGGGTGANGGRIAYSSNGIDWTIVSGNRPIGISSITWGDNKFVATGGTIMIYSSNGTDWTQVTNNTFEDDTPFVNNDIQSITYGNGKFVAVGRNGNIAYSSDGINWNAVTNSRFGNSHIYGVTYGNNMFVAVGSNGKAAYSADGISWTAIGNTRFGSSDTDNINDITWGNGKFVAVGSDGKIVYWSPDN